MDKGKNIEEITFDMRETKETKLMDSFLVLHQSTLVGMVVGMLVLGAIALAVYAFGKCWCSHLHRMCGERVREDSSEEVDMVEQGQMPARVTMIK